MIAHTKWLVTVKAEISPSLTLLIQVDLSFGGVILAPGALTDIWTRTFVADGASLYSGQEWINLSNESLFGVTDIIDVPPSKYPIQGKFCCI